MGLSPAVELMASGTSCSWLVALLTFAGLQSLYVCPLVLSVIGAAV